MEDDSRDNEYDKLTCLIRAKSEGDSISGVWWNKAGIDSRDKGTCTEM